MGITESKHANQHKDKETKSKYQSLGKKRSQISNVQKENFKSLETSRQVNKTPSTEAIAKVETQQEILNCIFDYTSRAHNDISIKVGEKYLILDKTDKNWWIVQNKITGERGYAPSNYFGKIESGLNNYEWFFGNLSRQKAEQILIGANVTGSYLVRESDTTVKTYALSLLDEFFHVKHYRIQCTEEKIYYINERLKFRNLVEVIEHYKIKYEGLAYPLTSVPLRNPPETVGLGKDTWEVPRSSIKLTEKLGSGNFGEVWKGIWNEKITVAVKTLKEGKMSREEFLSEANVMKNFKHPKLVQLLAVCTEGNPIYIITEYMEYGSLKNYLQKYSYQLPSAFLKQIIYQVAEGMCYLEQKNFVHRDLAARNVLVGSNLICKVADFGLTNTTEELLENKSAKIPVKWSAPEAIKKRQFSVKSDVWSFGILIWEVFSLGAVPYVEFSNQDTVTFITNGGRLSKPKLCTPSIYSLMLKCWDESPDKRPTFKMISKEIDQIMADEMSENKAYTDIIYYKKNTSS